MRLLAAAAALLLSGCSLLSPGGDGQKLGEPLGTALTDAEHACLSIDLASPDACWTCADKMRRADGQPTSTDDKRAAYVSCLARITR